MKKLLIVLISCILVVGLVYASTTTSVIYNIVNHFVDETPISTEIINNAWYFNILNNNEADVYKRITTAVTNYDENVILLSEEKISLDSIDKAFEAFLLDNADVFYLDNEFVVKELTLPKAYKYEINLKYTIDDKQEIDTYKQQIDQVTTGIIDMVITDDMNDFEKEVAIHDYLVSNTKYYEYTNIDDIPHEKHNIYSTLVKKEAVCDGFSKAFQVILEKLGIDVITVTGRTDSESHAWNKVKLEDKWYNVDVTSDTVTVSNEKLVTHVYFNLDDNTMSATHRFNNDFVIPESNSVKYNYYAYLDYEIQPYEQLNSELSKIISKNKLDILEFKVINEAYNKQEIVNAIYELNFNNYRDNNITNIEYFYQDNIYMLVKD